MRLILIVLTVLLLGCTDETPSKSEDCSCGTIANDGIDGDCYWLEIRNDCSGNKKKFCFDEDIWMNGHPGDHFCVTNQPSW